MAQAAAQGAGSREHRAGSQQRLPARCSRLPALWWFGSLLVIGGAMASLYSGGQRSRLPIVNGLDSYFPAHAVLARDDSFLAPLNSVFQPILGGIPRGCLPSETRAFIWLYRYLPPFTAYVVMEAVIRAAALAGMVLLLRRHVLPGAPAEIVFGASLGFSLLPFYVHADLSVAGQPLLLYALMNIRQRDRSPWNWLIVLLFPFVSSLPFVGFAILPLLAAWIAAEWIAARRFPAGLAAALVLLTAGYGASEYRLMASFLAGAGLSRTGRSLRGKARYSRRHAGPHSAEPGRRRRLVCAEPAEFRHRPRGRAGLGRRTRTGAPPGRGQRPFRSRVGPRGGPRRQLLLLLMLVLLCVAISVWWGICSSRAFAALMDVPSFRALKMVQLQRLNWFHAALWTLVFAASLAIIASALPRGRFIVWGLAAMQAGVAISGQYAEHQQQPLTFAEFYSPGLFREIRDYIGVPAADYRVASLGMHPAIALYNGFRTVDGYWVNYPLEYKHRFRKAIAGELAKAPKLAAYFDGWGSRCYLFSAELGQQYLYTKESPKRRVERLDVDTAALAELGTKYILSAVDIGNAAELGLNLKAVFQRSDSPWRIYLYEVSRRR